MKSFKMARPKTLAGAQSVLSGDAKGAAVLAGGTDLLAMIKERAQEPDMLVNLKGVQALSGVGADGDWFRIGALETLVDIAENEAVRSGWPALVTTIANTATPQVRNTATIAGNLCQRARCAYFRNEHYDCLKKGGAGCPARDGVHETHAIFDNAICSAPQVSNLAPVLIAYDAELEIASAKGSRRVLVEEFFAGPEVDVTREFRLEPGEVVTAVWLPQSSRSGRAAYVEARHKRSYDWALAGATVRLVLDGDKVKDARVVVSAVAPTPLRRRDLEELLGGQRVDDRRIGMVVAKVLEGATPLRDNAYKGTMLQAVLARALREAREA